LFGGGTAGNLRPGAGEPAEYTGGIWQARAAWEAGDILVTPTYWTLKYFSSLPEVLDQHDVGAGPAL